MMMGHIGKYSWLSQYVKFPWTSDTLAERPKAITTGEFKIIDYPDNRSCVVQIEPETTTYTSNHPYPKPSYLSTGQQTETDICGDCQHYNIKLQSMMKSICELQSSVNALVNTNRVREDVTTSTISNGDYKNEKLIRDFEEKLNKRELDALKRENDRLHTRLLAVERENNEFKLKLAMNEKNMDELKCRMLLCEIGTAQNVKFQTLDTQLSAITSALPTICSNYYSPDAEKSSPQNLSDRPPTTSSLSSPSSPPSPPTPPSPPLLVSSVSVPPTSAPPPPPPTMLAPPPSPPLSVPPPQPPKAAPQPPMSVPPPPPPPLPPMAAPPPPPTPPKADGKIMFSITTEMLKSVRLQRTGNKPQKIKMPVGTRVGNAVKEGGQANGPAAVRLDSQRKLMFSDDGDRGDNRLV